ncbi:MAG: sugar O-acetyltransferase [Boseongicola sp.]|nr:sugar O-acetyltransferase [Boseongicola sp.]
MSEPERGYDRMLAGLYYSVPDAELEAMQATATENCRLLNATGHTDIARRNEILKGFLKSYEGVNMIPRITIEYGLHLSIGRHVFINTNCTILDGAPVTIQDCVAIGPNVMLLTAGHSVVPEERYVVDPETGDFSHAFSINKPITIEDHCWLGAGTIVLGGVTIGEGTTVAAGSVVTRSLPARVLAGGSPARVIREIPERASLRPGQTP